MLDDANYISKVICTSVCKRNTFSGVEKTVLNNKHPEKKIMQ